LWDLLRAMVVLLGLAGAAGYLYWSDQDVIAGVAHVVDGDTVRIDGTVIRLKGLDAPEMHQTCHQGSQSYACGEVAKGALVRMAAHGVMICRVAGQDRYRRTLAHCSVDGEDVGSKLVADGLAIGYGGYRAEETLARARKAGLWSGTFQKPEDWRREHRPGDHS
jgi:endonuclease YncB( thermonuclease family)